VKDEKGVWRITGNKIFITSGHGNYHLVLAKTADEPSLDSPEVQQMLERRAKE